MNRTIAFTAGEPDVVIHRAERAGYAAQDDPNNL
jgi:hypothetical protein